MFIYQNVLLGGYNAYSRKYGKPLFVYVIVFPRLLCSSRMEDKPLSLTLLNQVQSRCQLLCKQGVSRLWQWELVVKLIP